MRICKGKIQKLERKCAKWSRNHLQKWPPSLYVTHLQQLPTLSLSPIHLPVQGATPSNSNNYCHEVSEERYKARRNFLSPPSTVYFLPPQYPLFMASPHRKHLTKFRIAFVTKALVILFHWMGLTLMDQHPLDGCLINTPHNNTFPPS